MLNSWNIEDLSSLKEVQSQMRFTDEFYQIFREQFLFIQIIAENGKVKSCAQHVCWIIVIFLLNKMKTTEKWKNIGSFASRILSYQPGPTVQHVGLYSVLGASLGGRGVWGRMDACICTDQYLHCSPETTKTLLIPLLQFKTRSLKFEKKMLSWKCKDSSVSEMTVGICQWNFVYGH